MESLIVIKGVAHVPLDEALETIELMRCKIEKEMIALDDTWREFIYGFRLKMTNPSMN